jgi:hypothetical protein
MYRLNRNQLNLALIPKRGAEAENCESSLSLFESILKGFLRVHSWGSTAVSTMKSDSVGEAFPPWDSSSSNWLSPYNKGGLLESFFGLLLT